MIDKNQRQQLKQLISSPQWSAIDGLINELIQKYRAESGSRDTEWETIRNTLINEGKIRGLTELTQEIYLQIQQNES